MGLFRYSFLSIFLRALTSRNENFLQLSFWILSINFLYPVFHSTLTSKAVTLLSRLDRIFGSIIRRSSNWITPCFSRALIAAKSFLSCFLSHLIIFLLFLGERGKSNCASSSISSTLKSSPIDCAYLFSSSCTSIFGSFSIKVLLVARSSFINSELAQLLSVVFIKPVFESKAFFEFLWVLSGRSIGFSCSLKFIFDGIFCSISCSRRSQTSSVDICVSILCFSLNGFKSLFCFIAFEKSCMLQINKFLCKFEALNLCKAQLIGCWYSP
ncbi:unnamed protein product [Moneuplotes crassus]|uniref:Uncharacterized protein n=1 Tax=Euplotes crassus TaxID=5936 RepID=A0AAD1U4F8_EUPCR|nr:unnamed protein product [Moneuplotes crassus]